MDSHLLTSRHNPFLRLLRMVMAQSHRAPENLVVCEGIRPLEEATRSGSPIRGVLTSEDFGSDERERHLMDEWEARSIPRYHSPAAVFSEVSDLRASRGALALIELARLQPAAVELGRRPLLVCLAGVQDPGNLGTIIRSAAAAGASAVFCLKGTVSPRNPKVVRASVGALFHLPVAEGIAPESFQQFCRQRSVKMYRTSPDAGTAYYDTALATGCALVLGNEGSGLDGREWKSLPCLRIPMPGGAESLNVGVAAAILLFEAVRQRAKMSRNPS